MDGTIVLMALNAKYVHASPAPWCLAAGIKAYAPQIYSAVRIVDATVNQPLADVLAQIVSNRPTVVGMTCYLWNISATLTLCGLLEKALPQVIIVLGGPEVSYCAKAVLEQNPQVDYILAGEGEESLPAFLTAVFTPNSPTRLPESAGQSIAGLCGRRTDGTAYETA